MFDPSKGGSKLAQAFLENTATQAPQLPQIMQPQASGLPAILPPMMPPGAGQGGMGGEPEKSKMPGMVTSWAEGGNTGMPYSEFPPMWLFNDTEPGQMMQKPGMPGAQTGGQQQTPRHPSQAQLLAQAINRRAMERSGQ